MRVATVVLGLLSIVGGASEASESIQGPSAHRAAAVLADGVMSAPTISQFDSADIRNSPSGRYALENGSRNPLPSAMGFVPPQNPAYPRNYASFGEQFAPRSRDRYDPATIPLPATRTLEDHLLTGFIALMLIAYQLRRKHRFLRPHQFST